ncbi:hypothetical protein GCM10025864_25380 [Luteimicrobium album]|uniref:Uncharacterized protein n=1 Tax=Luteimicrobium album TaxID=1054550 RepID=A0ABQ6I473_9MICO|nr:hypothetical protein GCM10025864_25380 [Luteimicrobium album]
MLEDGEQERLHGGEVVQEARVGDPGACRDVPQRRAAVPLLGVELGGGVDDLPPSRPPLRVPARARSRRAGAVGAVVGVGTSSTLAARAGPRLVKPDRTVGIGATVVPTRPPRAARTQESSP